MGWMKGWTRSGSRAQGQHGLARLSTLSPQQANTVLVQWNPNQDIEGEGDREGRRDIQARVGFGNRHAHGGGNSDVGSTSAKDRKEKSVPLGHINRPRNQ